MSCPQPPFTVRIALPDLVRRTAHGVRHMSAADLAIRAALLLGCLVVAVWMIHRGELLWPVVVGALGALNLATDAVELYAAGTVCDHLQQEEDR